MEVQRAIAEAPWWSVYAGPVRQEYGARPRNSRLIAFSASISAAAGWGLSTIHGATPPQALSMAVVCLLTAPTAWKLLHAAAARHFPTIDRWMRQERRTVTREPEPDEDRTIVDKTRAWWTE